MDESPSNSPYARFRRIAWWFILMLVGLAVYYAVPSGLRGDDPFRDSVPFSFPSFAASGPGGSMVVIDDSLRRIVLMDESGRRTEIISGGSRDANRFFYAQEAVLSQDGSLFVLNWRPAPDGYFLEREEIQEYAADGRLRRVLHQVDFTSAERGGYRVGMRPLSRGLQVTDQGIRWLELTAKGIQAWSSPTGEAAARQAERELAAALAAHGTAPVDDESATHREVPPPVAHRGHFYPLPDAQTAVADARFFGINEIVVTHKVGDVLRLAPDREPVALFRSSDSTRRTPDGVAPVPWGLAAASDGTVYFTDLTFREIVRLPPAAPGDTTPPEPQTVWAAGDLYTASPAHATYLAEQGIDPDSTFFLRLSISPDGTLGTASANTVVLFPGGEAVGRRISDGFRPVSTDRWHATAGWAGLGIAVLAGLFLLRSIYVDGFRRKPPRGLVQAAGLVTLIALALGSTMPILITRLVERNSRVEDRQLDQLLHTLPQLIDGDLVKSLQNPSDYGNADYRELRRQLQDIFFAPGARWNQGVYCTLYRFRDNRIYGLIGLNDEESLFFPFSWDDTDIYREAFEEGKTTITESADATGDWRYGVTPVKDSRGEIVAVLETGIDRHMLNLAVRELLWDTVLDALTMVVVLLLLLFEFLFFLNLVRRFPPPLERANERAWSTSPYFLARPAICLFFFALSFPSAFQALMAQELHRPEDWIPLDFALAAPLSMEMLCFGLAVLLAGRMVEHFGAATTIHSGFLVTALGLLFGGFCDQVLPYILANGAIGAGSGIGFIGIRSLLLREKALRWNDIGFSHFYSGMTAGGYAGLGVGSALAVYFGYAATFQTAAVLMILAWLVVWRGLLPLLPPTPPPVPEPAAEAGGKKFMREEMRFFCNPRIMAFMLLHLLPVYVLGSFVSYYFPIFAEGAGLSVGDIGRLLLLHGLLVVYWGPVASEWLLPELGSRWSLLLGQVAFAGGMVVFAATDNLWGAVGALVLMGLFEGIGAVGENAYLLSLPASRKLGVERVVALGELTGKIGETSGPIIFALALALGGLAGLLGLGVIGLLLTGAFLMSLRLRDQTPKPKTPSQDHPGK